MNDYSIIALKEDLRSLAGNPFVPVAVKYLVDHVDAINRELNQTVLADIPAFTDSGNPEIVPEFTADGSRHTQEILRLLAGGPVGDFQFVRRYAERRAGQRFPLEALLHAYRCSHKIYLHWIRQAVLAALPETEDAQEMVAAIADFTIEYTDAISTVATGSYLAQTRLLAAVAGDERAELLNILLDGYDESDGRVAGILRRAAP